MIYESTPEAYTVQRSIEDSIREQRTITLAATVDTENWVRLSAILNARAEDWVETDQGSNYPRGIGKVREYWGTDDNDEWRIHLIF